LRTTRLKRSAAALAVLFAPGAYGAHPLNTEDTGVQGRGKWQLELNGERNQDHLDDETMRGAQAAAVLSYGITDSVDLQAGVTWQDIGPERGAGDAIAAVKWRFWEREPWSLGMRAGVTLPTGDEERGLGNGRTTWSGLLIGEYEGERWIFLSHLGYRRNHNAVGNRDSIREISGAVLYKPTEGLKLLIDATRTTNPDPASDQALRQVVVGFIWSLTKDMDLDAGIRRGNEAGMDKAVMAGVTLRW